MLSCITNSMRWDRKNGDGCVPSMIAGTGAEGYYDGEDDDNSHCAKDGDKYDDSGQTCSYLSASLNDYHTDATACWTNTGSISGIDYLMNNFCNPVLTKEKLDDETFNTLKTSVTDHCT